MLNPKALCRARVGPTLGAALIGLSGMPVAALADDTAARTSDQTSQLSEEVERFNESGGALEPGRNAEPQPDAAEEMRQQGGTAGSETAENLSEEIDAYNSSGGSMEATDPARVGTEDSADATVSTGGHPDHSKAEELSKELERHNKNR